MIPMRSVIAIVVYSGLLKPASYPLQLCVGAWGCINGHPQVNDWTNGTRAHVCTDNQHEGCGAKNTTITPPVPPVTDIMYETWMNEWMSDFFLLIFLNMFLYYFCFLHIKTSTRREREMWRETYPANEKGIFTSSKSVTCLNIPRRLNYNTCTTSRIALASGCCRGMTKGIGWTEIRTIYLPV